MLSKSNLLSFRQCPRKLWLETRSPELAERGAMAEQLQAAGEAVGELARTLFDAEGKGVLIDRNTDRLAERLKKTRSLFDSDVPVFEAAFAADGGYFHADILETGADGKRRIIEVKSSGEIKDHHYADAAIQWHVARAAGHDIGSVSIAHLDKNWIYQGDGDYDGVLKIVDVTDKAKAAAGAVPGWIDAASNVVNSPDIPHVSRGKQCGDPHECGFAAHCRSMERRPEFPADQLPGRMDKELLAAVRDAFGARDLREIPDNLLNERQKIVKRATLNNELYFDAEGAAADLAGLGFPAYFLDFETIRPAVPLWAGRGAMERVAFQYSLHVLGEDGALDHRGFLAESEGDPSRELAMRLVKDCDLSGPIFVYNKGVEGAVIRELAALLPDMADALLAMEKRIVDLMLIARKRYYHPRQRKSWSIKELLPTIAPELSYAALDGVSNGGSAMAAYDDAVGIESSRRSEARRQLEEYCALDTLATVKLWAFFAGNMNTNN